MRTLLLSTLLLSVVLALELPTLNSDKELKATGFGQPPPHHGLKLLKWYVNTCLDKQRKSKRKCNPSTGRFGFHLYNNRESLLPKPQAHKRYFSIGNLNSENAQKLPNDVKEYYNSSNPQSNADRVLVEYGANRIRRIFISEHYKKNKTYMIGSNLFAFLRKSARYFHIEM